MTPTGLLDWALAHPELAMTIATMLGGVLGAGQHYQRTGRVPLGRLPWRAAQQAWGELADHYFGRTRPRGIPGLLVDATPSELEATLRGVHFEDVDDASFEYEDEALGLRRPEGTHPHPETGAAVPMELHPRVFRTATDRSLVITHIEASRMEAWGLHLDGTLLSWERGRGILEVVLDDMNLEYEEIESERTADVDVRPPQNGN